MTNYSLSVLTPARNEQNKILKSVRSVLRQLRDGDELIVYDDNSTDRTVELLKSITDKRLRLIEGRAQVGTAMASNILLDEAKNEIVARLDADDYSLPGRFDYQRRILGGGKHDMLFGLAVQKKGALMVPQIPKELNTTKIRLLLPFVNPLVNSTLMTRKSLINELGGCPEGYGGEDYSLFLRAAISKKTLLRSNKYLVVREVPLKHEPKEARQRPWNKDLGKHRVELLRQLQSESLFIHEGELGQMSYDQVLSLILSTEDKQNVLRKTLNRLLG